MLVQSLAFSNDSAVLMAADDALDTCAWLLDTGKPLFRESLDDFLIDLSKKAGESDDALPSDLEPDAPKLTPQGKAYVRGLQAPTGLEPLDFAAQRIKRPPERPFRVLSPDGQWFAAIHPETKAVETWHAATAKLVATMTGKASRKDSPIAFSANGELVAAEIQRGMTAVWDAAAGRRLITLRRHNGDIDVLAFSPDNKYLATTAAIDHAVAVWGILGGAPESWIQGWQSPVNSLAFFKIDGKTHLAAAEADSIGIFEIPSLRTIARIPSSAVGAKDEGIDALAISPDGTTVALAVALSAIHLFDTADLLGVGNAIPDDPVNVAVAKADPATQPAPKQQARADADLRAFVQAHITQALTPAFEREFSAIFNNLPRNTTQILFELDLLYGYHDGSEVGLYWAAQNKFSNTLVAYEFKPFKSVLLSTKEYREKDQPHGTRLWDIQHDLIVQTLADLWNRLAPKRLRGLVFISLSMDNRIFDLADRTWHDRTETLYPGHETITNPTA